MEVGGLYDGPRAPLLDFVLKLKEACEGITHLESRHTELDRPAFEQWICEAVEDPFKVGSSPPRRSQSGLGRARPQATDGFGQATDINGIACPRLFSLIYSDSPQTRRATDPPGKADGSPPKRARIDATTVPLSPWTLADRPRRDPKSPNRDMRAKGRLALPAQKGLSMIASPCRAGAKRLGPAPASPPRPLAGAPAAATGVDAAAEAVAPAPPRGAPEGATAPSAPVDSQVALASARARDSGVAPATFAQPSCMGDPNSPVSPKVVVPSTGWQGSALFAPPTLTPEGKKQAQAAPAASAGAVATPLAASLFGTSAAAVDKVVGHLGATDADASPQQSATPCSVSERIKMFETHKRPSWGQSSALGAVPHHGQRSGSSGSKAPGAAVGKVQGDTGGISGSALFEPVQRAVQEVRPQQLFQSHSPDMAGQGGGCISASEPGRGPPQGEAGATDADTPASERADVRVEQPPPLWRATGGVASAPTAAVGAAASSSSQGASAAAQPAAAGRPNLAGALGPSTFLQAGMRGAGGERVDGRPAGATTFERLAAGGRREDVAKPKSLKAAEQAKKQEERRCRERQEQQQERAAAAAAGDKQLSARDGGAAKSTPRTVGGVGAAIGVASPSEGRPAASSSSQSQHPQQQYKSKVAQADTSIKRSALVPPVAAVKDLALLLREVDMPPKLPEDNYEISENGGDSEDDEDKVVDRSHKHVPKWCETFLKDLEAQKDVDPDTIWGSRVPRCDLLEVFHDDFYRRAGKTRPKRARGSSGDWRQDRLARAEITDYKQRMGHVRSWEDFSGQAGAARLRSETVGEK